MAGHPYKPLPEVTPERQEWTTTVAERIRLKVKEAIDKVMVSHLEEIEAVEDVQWERAVLRALESVKHDATDNLNDGISLLENGEV